MKLFHTQFSECSKEGLVGVGKLLKFKNHSELLPHPIISNKAAKNVAKLLKKNPDAGLTPCVCLRFNNGRCNSVNQKCQELRKK